MDILNKKIKLFQDKFEVKMKNENNFSDIFVFF